MDKSIIEKVKKYSDILKFHNYPIDMVILYGSYAKGIERKYSDIDVAIVFDEIEGDFLDLISNLYKLAVEVDDRIETVVLEKKNDKSGFLESILKYGTIVYKNN